MTIDSFTQRRWTVLMISDFNSVTTFYCRFSFWHYASSLALQKAESLDGFLGISSMLLFMCTFSRGTCQPGWFSIAYSTLKWNQWILVLWMGGYDSPPFWSDFYRRPWPDNSSSMSHIGLCLSMLYVSCCLMSYLINVSCLVEQPWRFLNKKLTSFALGYANNNIKSMSGVHMTS